MPKEIPILFSTPMVQAIDAVYKTQTRRIIKADISPKATIVEPSSAWPSQGDWIAKFKYPKEERYEVTNHLKCPYGKEGDKLWVRETWRMVAGNCLYKALHDGFAEKWKPSIHMKKEAARLWLKNTGVIAEKLHSISDEDCQKEGAIYDPSTRCYFVRGTDIKAGSYHEAFKKLWIKVNGLKSWESNPWVWVVSFERIWR